MLLLCTCVFGILSYEQIFSAARDYSLCVRLHSSGIRPAVYCLLLRIGIPNENHDDTEQISSDTIVDGYRLRTDDVVRATCIRGVRATAVSSHNTEYTRSISTASTTAIILLYVLYESLPSNRHVLGRILLKRPKKSCRPKIDQTSRLTIEYEYMSTAVSGKTKGVYEYSVRLVYLPVITRVDITTR